MASQAADSEEERLALHLAMRPVKYDAVDPGIKGAVKMVKVLATDARLAAPAPWGGS